MTDPTERDETPDGTFATTDIGRDGVAAGAMFHATRDELLGVDALLDSAEIARSYCAVADRVVSIVAITPGRVRRVDGWLGRVAFVTHAAANDPSQRLLGAVADRTRAVALTGSIIASLVGGLPGNPAHAVVDVGVVGAIRPDAMPIGVDWIVMVSARRTFDDAPPHRCVVASASGGLVMSEPDSLDDPMHADPGTAADLDRFVGKLIGTRPRSVSEVLADDRPRQRDIDLLPD